MKPNSITITYLSKVSFASLNGADKEVDNINPIKKVTLNSGQELPYVSSQAIRRAIRDQLIEMGFERSSIQQASAEKGPPKTLMNPVKFIEDDLFGYMDASPGKDGEKGKSVIRTSPIRVESLLALSKYQGDLDYATNFMGKESGADPNIFETEIHSGIYRGTILIELDRIGSGQGFEEDGELDNQRKRKRVKAFLNAFQNLWSSGRQTRFLADISPKFIAAAYMKAKNPIFLEAVSVNNDREINLNNLNTVVEDYSDFIEEHAFAIQESVFNFPKNLDDDESGNGEEKVFKLGEGFEEVKNWVEKHYSVENSSNG
jgi:CRISPR-associated protein Cst2